MKGFTTIELIVSVILATGIVFFLFQIVNVVNNQFIENDNESKRLNDISLISYEINRTLLNDVVTKVEECGDNCYNFTFENNEVLKLSLQDNIISFGNYSKKIEDIVVRGIFVNNAVAPVFNSDIDSMLLIEIPLSGMEFEYFESIKIVYQYDSAKVLLQGI